MTAASKVDMVRCTVAGMAESAIVDTLALQNAKKNTNNVNGQGEKGASSDDLQKEGDVIMLQDIIPVAHPEPSS